MSPKPAIDPSVTLRQTAAEFVRLRGVLQQAGALRVVISSPITKKRVDVLNKRAGMIQDAIEHSGRMIDGARRWFSDTFGSPIEQTVPLANPAIGASVQTSIAAMKFFMRDAKAELNRIIASQRALEAAPKEKQSQILAELGAQSVPDKKPDDENWLLMGAIALGAFLLIKEFSHGES